MEDSKREILKSFSKDLRRNMTPEEKHLWYDFLKKLPVSIKRQQIIGDYIVDFYCPKYKLVIEIDGKQHKTEEGKESDGIRDKFLYDHGLKVARYTNTHINKCFGKVCTDILLRLKIDPSKLKTLYKEDEI